MLLLKVVSFFSFCDTINMMNLKCVMYVQLYLFSGIILFRFLCYYINLVILTKCNELTTYSEKAVKQFQE